jgi:hypothetical protein
MVLSLPIPVLIEVLAMPKVVLNSRWSSRVYEIHVLGRDGMILGKPGVGH